MARARETCLSLGQDKNINFFFFDAGGDPQNFQPQDARPFLIASCVASASAAPLLLLLLLLWLFSFVSPLHPKKKKKTADGREPRGNKNLFFLGLEEVKKSEFSSPFFLYVHSIQQSYRHAHGIKTDAATSERPQKKKKRRSVTWNSTRYAIRSLIALLPLPSFFFAVVRFNCIASSTWSVPMRAKIPLVVLVLGKRITCPLSLLRSATSLVVQGEEEAHYLADTSRRTRLAWLGLAWPPP